MDAPKAARRLVVAADIMPNELRRRSSVIRAGYGAKEREGGGKKVELECRDSIQYTLESSRKRSQKCS